jgi:magnesium-transporting ATPase (P-type)
MKIHQLPLNEVYASLQTSRGGLTADEAHRRFTEFGPNRIEPPPRTPLVVRLLKEFTHFFAVILWIGAALAFWAEWQSPGQGMATLGQAIVGVIIINGVFSFWQVYRAERALAALERLLPHRVKVFREGAFAEVPTPELVPGDVISVETGDLVSADCRVLEAFSLKVNNAAVTGESIAADRTSDPTDAEGGRASQMRHWA